MLKFQRAKAQATVIDLRKYGAGLVIIETSRKVTLSFDADSQVPIDRAEVFAAKEERRAKGEAA